MPAAPAKASSQWLIIGTLSLAASVLAPLLSMLRAIFGTPASAGNLEQQGLSAGVGELAGHIGEVLVATVVGMIVTLVCLPIAIYCLKKHSRLRKQQREAPLPQSPGAP